MNLFSKALSLFTKDVRGLIPQNIISDRGWTRIFDWKPGAWQQDVQIHQEAVMANWAVFSCLTYIASNAGKLRLKLVQNIDGIWTETTSPAFAPVIKKPNAYQTRQQFIEGWVLSLESQGNTYVLKERDNRGVVVALYVLDPCRVTPMVAPDGQVYYRLGEDYLSGITQGDVVVPAEEIIHHRINCLFHSLVGLSPIYANGLAATQGLNIQQNSAKFFGNMSMPGGILTSPHALTAEAASNYKRAWEEAYSGRNVGRIAVLGGGLEYKGLMQTAVDSQMLQTLQATAVMVCSTFHVPAPLIGAEPIPVGQTRADLDMAFYKSCLQSILHGIENLLDEGLGIDTPKDGTQYGTMFELDDLLMMDQGSLTTVLRDQVGAGITKIDEARARLNYAPTPGGDTPYLQQQNYSLEALAKRDAQDDPFGTAKPPVAPAAPAPQPSDLTPVKVAIDYLQKSVADELAALSKQNEKAAEVQQALLTAYTELKAMHVEQQKVVEEAKAQTSSLESELFTQKLIAKFTSASHAK